MKKWSEQRSPVLKPAAFVLAAALGMLSFTACQPVVAEASATPKVLNTVAAGETVQPPAATDATITQAPQIPLAEYKAAGHWEEQVRDGKLTVNIGADILMPGVKSYPVVQVEPLVMTQQEVDRLAGYFAAGGNKLYAYPEVKTKSDWWKIMDGYKAEYGDKAGDSMIAFYEEKISDAPESYQRKYTDTRLTYILDEYGDALTDSGKNFLTVGVEDGNDGDTVIQVTNYNGNGYFTSFKYGRGMWYEKESVLAANPGISIEEYGAAQSAMDSVRISKEDAFITAQKVLEDLAVKDMRLVNTEKASLISWEYKNYGSPETVTGGYVFEYFRESGGIPAYGQWGLSNQDGNDMPDYIPPYGPEEIDILVSDEGVVFFYWHSRVKVVKTVTENAQLLPMDEIKEKLKAWIERKKEWYLQQEDVVDLTVWVDDAKLSIDVIEDENEKGKALLVPVWVFGIRDTANYAGYSGAYRANSYMYVLNALDGGTMPP